MVLTFGSTNNLVNSMIKINSSNINIVPILDSKSNKLQISCKYFLTLFDIHNDLEIKNFFSYMTDETRTIVYPFVKDAQIDYSLMLEIDQFYNIDLDNTNLNIKDISNNIDNFINIVKESNGQIVFVLDICYLLNFMVGLKTQSKPNHLIDMILYKLSNNTLVEISDIYILDKQSLIKNTSNLLYTQLDKCMNKSITKLDDKNIHIYKGIEESLMDNVYWNILQPEMKISKHIDKIKSPFDDSYFNLVKINDKEYFVKKINISECVDKNLFNLDKNHGIIIDPIERIFI
jgi:hypothetical protein